MTTIRPFWYDGNGYHLFLIDGWRIKTRIGASKYLTGCDCGTEYISYAPVWGVGGRTDRHHLFNPYSEFYFGDVLYSIFWPEGEFYRGRTDPYRSPGRIRNKESEYGWHILYNISTKDFKKYLINRLKLIEDNKQKLTEYRKPDKRVGCVKL